MKTVSYHFLNPNNNTHSIADPNNDTQPIFDPNNDMSWEKGEKRISFKNLAY
jgi:hypothetical protein